MMKDARGFVRGMVVLVLTWQISTSVLKLFNAFDRKGLALDQAQVSQDQVMRADRDFPAIAGGDRSRFGQAWMD
jgi:hypothetical protein